MLKEIDLGLDVRKEDTLYGRPVGVIESVANDLKINELAYEIELETHKLSYTSEVITGIENSILTSIESGKVIVTDIIKVLADNINNMNNEAIIDIYEEGIIVGRENSVYLEGIMDRIKKAAKAIWEKIKAIIKKIKEFLKKLLNKILGKKSSSGSSGKSSSVSKVVTPEEENNLNKLIELINNGDKELITEYINTHFRSYKELLLELLKHDDVIEIGLTTKGEKIKVNNITIKDSKKFDKLDITTETGEAKKHFNEIKNSINIFNKYRESNLFSDTAVNEINLQYTMFLKKIQSYINKLGELNKDFIIGKLLNIEGSIGEINLNKLTLSDYATGLEELTHGLPKCIESVKKGVGKTTSEDETDHKDTYKEFSKKVRECLGRRLRKTYIKNGKLTGDINKDIEIKPIDSLGISGKLTVEINNFIKEVEEKIYNTTKKHLKIEIFAMLAILFNNVKVEKIIKDDLADNLNIIINLEIETSGDVSRHLDIIRNLIDTAFNIDIKIEEINNRLQNIITLIFSTTELLDNNINKLEKEDAEQLTRIINIITNNIINPLKNITNMSKNIKNLLDEEESAIDNIRASYSHLMKDLYHVAIIKKALEVTSESE